MINGLKNFKCEERLRQLELFSLEKAQNNLISVYEYLKGGCREVITRLFNVVPIN